jgi:hypothetical protein
MHFAGLHRTPEITCSTYLGERWDDLPAGAPSPDENTDDVTGQSFTMAASSTRGTVAKLGKPVPPAAECDAITSSFA